MKSFININGAKEFVRDNSDLYTLISYDIGDDIEWQEEGNNVMVCCSPFREESKPSFKVKDNKFKDWGGEQYSGDIFSWCQLWHGHTFVESIFYVADRFNLDLTKYIKQPTDNELLEARYKSANKIAAEYMHQMLRQNNLVRNDYLSRSGFTLDQIEPYLVGYINSIDSLISHVCKEIPLTDDDISKLEFNRKDLFTNSIVYPVHSHSGEVLFFYTKQLNNTDASYKGNRKEHPLRNPGILYGFHEAKKSLRTNNSTLVLVEGFRDAIALQAAGVMSSSINPQQLESVKKYKIKKLIICYDGDVTGWTKSLELVSKPQDFGEALVLIARPNTDQDPHDIWKTNGDIGVQQMLDSAKLPIEYYIDSHYNISDGLSITDKHEIFNSLKEFFINSTGLQLDIATSYLAEVMNSTTEHVRDEVAKIKANFSQLFNLEAERTLIAYCMQQSSFFNIARSAGVDTDSFTISGYKRLFNACKIAYDKYNDKYSAQVVFDEAMVNALSSDLKEEINIVVTRIFTGDYKYTDTVACELVLDMWRRRIASEQANEMISVSRDLSRPFIDIVNKFRSTLVSTISSSRPQARTPQELRKELHDEVKYREQYLHGNLIIGYDFGSILPSINLILGGIQRGHLIVIAGDTGAGKSLLALNMAKAIAIDAKEPFLWIGAEMKSVENTMRLASIISGVSNTKIQTGNLNPLEAKMYAQAEAAIEASCFYYAKPRVGHIDDLLAIVDEYRWRYGIKSICYDYAGLITRTKDQYGISREELIGNVSTTFKNVIAEDMGLAAILIAQMNRDRHAEGKTKIGGSYRLMQDADDFIYIEEKTDKQIAEDGDSSGNRYVKIGKRRGGISKFKTHVELDTEKTVSLRIHERSTMSEIGQVYKQLTCGQ